MRLTRHIAVLVGVALALAGAARAQDVDSPTGGLGVGVAVKWIYSYIDRDSRTRTPPLEEFNTSLVDLYFRAVLNDNVYFDLELAAVYNSDRRVGAAFNGVSSQGEVSMIGVRQAKIKFPELIPYTQIEVGTFIPPITNYMARGVTDLDFINYPLLNAATFYNTGLYGTQPAANDFSIWQQAGFNVAIQFPELIKIDLGMWNGIMPPGSQANVDANIAKASSVVLTVLPTDNLSISMAY